MNPLRSIAAVLVGLGAFSLVSQLLEVPLVRALAGAPIPDVAAYYAQLNQPFMLAARPLYTMVAGILAGYIAAKVAGYEELRHGIITGGVQTLSFVYGFTAGEFAAFTPLWLRVTLVLVTGPSMVVGALVRARAVRALAAATSEAGAQPDAEGSKPGAPGR
ncbi:MAG: hypothetical protein AB7G23_15815 [Vicinamibacterales bacterium]